MINENIVKFEAKYGNASVAGWMDIEDCDDEKPLNFYNEQGFEIGTQFPSNPFPKFHDGIRVLNHEEFETLKHEFLTDELLIQFLVDFYKEKKTINRNKYTIYINGGD